MARIPTHELERIKQEISVQRLAEARGIELKKHGKDLLGLCPFHEDHDPSLVITPSKNLWNCLGACGTGGGPIDWVMKAEGVSFRHAVEILRNDVALPSTSSSKAPPARSITAKLPPVVKPDLEDQELLRRVVSYYHKTLLSEPKALEYLAQRGLRSAEAIERFQLGFSNRTLGYRLPAKTTKEGQEMRARLRRLGVLRSSGHEHLNGSLVVPVIDGGEVTELYGRKITSSLRKGTPDHLYLPGPHRGVFNAAALEGAEEIILCESLIDALTFWGHGYRNVTAAYGTNGFTSDHLAAFERWSTKRVLIAFDRDEAGDKAAAVVAQKLSATGIASYRVHFPRGMDANAYALDAAPARLSLGVRLRKAEWIPSSVARSALSVAEHSLTEEIGALKTSDGEAEQQLRKESESADEGAPSGSKSQERTESSHNGEEKPTSGLWPEDTGWRDPKEAPPLAASPLPARPKADVPTEQHEHEVVITLGERRYRIRNLEKNLGYGQLRVNVFVSREGTEGLFHVDTLDLYSSRQRSVYITQAARELCLEADVVKHDIGRVLLKLEELQDEQIQRALRPETKTVTLSDTEEAEALELLRSPDLLTQILQDFDKCGVVGEESNKLLGYLTAVSRQLETPLAVIIQSSSAAGKTALMEAVLGLMPDESQTKYSAMTGQSLFYMGEADLKHKILAIVEEEGAERASYALKLLQSEGELTIASTGKDPSSGRLVTHEYRVEGPVAIFLTTTAIDVDEELQNRCLVLTVDEDRPQTRAIHERQRHSQTLEGLLAGRDRAAIVRRHQNAQRLLRPVMVANPYAEDLTFLDSRTRARRDHMKYLTLIRAIALLHQHQRLRKSVAHEGRRVEYIEATLADIEVANRLMHEVLGRSLDELAPQTRRLLMLLSEMVNEACERDDIVRSDYRFTRRGLRHYTGWSYDQVRVHLDRLVELEYVLVHQGGRGQRFVYELVFDGTADGKPHFSGLIDVAHLKGEAPTPSTTQSLGSTGGNLGVPLDPDLTHIGNGEKQLKGSNSRASSETLGVAPENAYTPSHNGRTYLLGRRTQLHPPLAAGAEDASLPAAEAEVH